jgi:hypothetical protein
LSPPDIKVGEGITAVHPFKATKWNRRKKCGCPAVPGQPLFNRIVQFWNKFVLLIKKQTF